MLSFTTRKCFPMSKKVVKFLSTSEKPPAFLIASNGARVPYPVGIKKPITFPILYVGTDALRDYLPDHINGALLINKAQEIYTNVYRPFLMLMARGSWVVCSSNSEIILVRTAEEAEELAYRHFQPADGSVDCYVGCVGSEFCEAIEFGDLVIHEEV